MNRKPTPPLSPEQIQHVCDLFRAEIHRTLHALADQFEIDPDPLGVRKALARGLRPDPLFPEAHDV